MVSGCVTAVGPDYQRPETPLPEAFRAATQDPDSGPSSSEPVSWEAFGDPVLEQLITKAREQNHSLRAAAARLQQARALIGVARSEGRPAVALEPSIGRSQSSDEVEFLPGVTNGRLQTLYSLPVTARWELDLFGRIQRNQEAVVADAQATEADAHALALALETQVASSYYGLRALDAEIEVVRQGLELRRSSAQLIRDRVRLGAGTSLDQAQAENQVAQGEADFASLQRARSESEHALAVLLGETASQFALEPAPLQGTPPTIPPGLPSELLQRRPDVRRAERVLAAENARIGVAEAAFYPSLTLTGQAGWQSTESANWFSKNARIWGIAPNLYIPLFQGERNQRNLDRAKARYEEVVENYQQAVLEALAEVESTLASQKWLLEQSQAQGRAVEAANTARSVTRTRFEVGTVDYLQVLDAERTALDAERAQTRLLGTEFLQTVRLVQALGGQW